LSDIVSSRYRSRQNAAGAVFDADFGPLCDGARTSDKSEHLQLWSAVPALKVSAACMVTISSRVLDKVAALYARVFTVDARARAWARRATNCAPLRLAQRFGWKS
jgi:hypothetical protein